MGFTSVSLKDDTAEVIRRRRDERKRRGEKVSLDDVVRDALDEAGLLDEAGAMG